MVITIETTDDFLRALRGNGDFLAAARREILTQELIDLPRQFAEHRKETAQRFDDIDERIAALVANTEAMNRRVDAIDRRVDAMDKRMDGMDKRMDGMDKRIAVLVENTAAMNRRVDAMDKRMEGMDKRMEGMSTDIRHIRESHRTEHQAMHRFRGNYAIDAARNSEWDIAEMFAGARGVRRFRLRSLTREERDDMFDDNADAIERLDTEGNPSKGFPNGDIIAEVRRRNSDEPPFYVAVEASYTVDSGDVIRASDNAKILRAATGLDAYAVVSGVRVNPRLDDGVKRRITQDLTECVEADGDRAVFWFRLSDSSLEPPAPC